MGSSLDVPRGVVVDLAWSLPPNDTTEHKVLTGEVPAGSFTVDSCATLRRWSVDEAYADIGVHLMAEVVAQHGIRTAMPSTTEANFLSTALHLASSVRVESRQMLAAEPARVGPPMAVVPVNASDLPLVRHFIASLPGLSLGLSSSVEALTGRGELLLVRDLTGALVAVAELRPVPAAGQALLRLVRDPARGDIELCTGVLASMSWRAVEMGLAPLLTVRDEDPVGAAAAVRAGFVEVGQTMSLTFDRLLA